MKIIPIETQYAGVTFRSRLEARWAVFFDRLGVAWRYEPEGYHLDDIGEKYVPDFYLPRELLYIEIKPTRAIALGVLPKLTRFCALMNQHLDNSETCDQPRVDVWAIGGSPQWDDHSVFHLDRHGHNTSDRYRATQCPLCRRLISAHDYGHPSDLIYCGRCDFDRSYLEAEPLIPGAFFSKGDIYRPEYSNIDMHCPPHVAAAYDAAVRRRFWNPGAHS